MRNLENIKVGDVVEYWCYQVLKERATVVAVTAKTFNVAIPGRVGEIKFLKNNGKKFGRSASSYATSEYINDFWTEKSEARLKTQQNYRERRSLAAHLQQMEWRNFSLEQLESIAAHIKSLNEPTNNNNESNTK